MIDFKRHKDVVAYNIIDVQKIVRYNDCTENCTEWRSLYVSGKLYNS